MRRRFSADTHDKPQVEHLRTGDVVLAHFAAERVAARPTCAIAPTEVKIILIGPIGVGKTTVGRLVATELDVPCRHLDDIRTAYYREIGYDEVRAKKILEVDGFVGLYRYWKPFEIYAVERLVGENGAAVLDFGGGHSVYEDESLFARARRALAPHPYVILILPSEDRDESIAILRARRGRMVSNGFDFDEHFVRHHSNYDLAKHIVYTRGNTPEQTSAAIAALIRSTLAASGP